MEDNTDNKTISNALIAQHHDSSPMRILSILLFLNILFLGGIVYISYNTSLKMSQDMVRQIETLDIIEEIDASPSVTALVEEIIEEKLFDLIPQYNQEVRDIDSLIRILGAKAKDPEVKRIAGVWLETNDELTQIETNALEVAREGRNEEAEMIIDGLEYGRLIGDYDFHLDTCIEIARENLENSKDLIDNSISYIFLIGAGILVSLSLAWFISFRMMSRYISERKKMMANLLLASQQDPLTGLLNRFGFIAKAEELWSSDESRSGIALMFIDLDGLKCINDSYGHRAGDRAIKASGGIIKTTFRESDIIGRIGGDEFVVVIKRVSKEEFEACDRRLQKNQDAWNAQDKEDFRISMSMGVVTGDMSLEKALAEADDLMYQQKKRKKKDQGRQASEYDSAQSPGINPI